MSPPPPNYGAGYGPVFVINFSDINECTDGNNNCDHDATCKNDDGSFHCFCNAGFTGHGTYCEG